MIKKLLSALDYGLFAEIALVMFAVVFVAIVVRTLFMKREDTKHQAEIVLDEQPENQV